MVAEHNRTGSIPLGIDAKSFDRALLIGFCVVAGLGLIVEALAIELDDDWQYGLYPVVSLDYEQNLPTWYLMALYALAAILAGIAAAADRRGGAARLLWTTSAVTLIWLSLDAFSELGSILFSVPRPLAQWDTVELAIQHHALPLIAAGTGAAVVLALLSRYALRIVSQVLALPLSCQLRLIVGSALLAVVPFVEEWSLPQRLWYDLGGEESGEPHIGTALEWLESSTEIVGASLLCSAFIAYLAGETVSLVTSSRDARGLRGDAPSTLSPDACASGRAQAAESSLSGGPRP